MAAAADDSRHIVTVTCTTMWDSVWWELIISGW